MQLWGPPLPSFPAQQRGLPLPSLPVWRQGPPLPSFPMQRRGGGICCSRHSRRGSRGRRSPPSRRSSMVCRSLPSQRGSRDRCSPHSRRSSRGYRCIMWKMDLFGVFFVYGKRPGLNSSLKGQKCLNIHLTIIRFFPNILVHAHLRPHVCLLVWLGFFAYFALFKSFLSSFSMEILEKLLDHFNSV